MQNRCARLVRTLQEHVVRWDVSDEREILSESTSMLRLLLHECVPPISQLLLATSVDRTVARDSATNVDSARSRCVNQSIPSLLPIESSRLVNRFPVFDSTVV